MKTIIKLLLDEKSRNCFNEKFGTRENELHTTIYYAEEIPLFKTKSLQKELETILPVSIDPLTYKYSLFGDEGSDLVLTYENLEIREIHNKLIYEAVRQMITKWPNLKENEKKVLKNHNKRESQVYYEFNPHISIVKNWGKKLRIYPN